MSDREALARYYDLDLRDDPGDVDLYLSLAARTGGPVLELAAGSGRISVPLAAAGYAVTGVDNDGAMLARAERSWTDVEDDSAGDGPSNRGRKHRDRDRPGSLLLVEDDITSVRLEKRFGLVILALNTLLLLEEPERQVATLRTMAAHLRPDGLAVIDIWLPGPEDLALYDGRLLLEWVREDPETGDRVTKFASARFDSATATVVLTQLFDAISADDGTVRRTSRTDRLRLVAATELVRMAAEAGLEVDQLAGDHQMGAFGPGDERAVLVARLV